MDERARWRKYRDFGIGKGLSTEDSEDFAQETFMRWHGAGGAELNLTWCLTDFLRKKHGRTGYGRHRAGLCTRSLDEDWHEGQSGHAIVMAPGRDPESELIDRERDRLETTATGRRGVMMDLVLAGLMQREVADIFGLSEMRNYQEMKAARREVERHQFLGKSLQAYHDDQEASVLTIEWIRL